VDEIWIGSLFFLLLLLLDVLFAAARGAFVNSHPAKLRALQEEGIARASLAVRIGSKARRLILSLRAAQTISRISVLGLAMVVYALPIYALGAASPIWVGLLLLAAGLLIGVLEFMAESVALRDPERWAVRLAPLVWAVVNLFSPVGWIMARLIRWITGAPVDRPHPLVTEEEIMTLVDAGEEEGVIEQEEKAMIYSIFQLADTLAREIMVPRIDILAFEENTPLVDATETFLQTGFSRAPVFSENIDNIVGVLYVKDLLAAWKSGEQDQSVTQLLREAFFVPEAKKVYELMTEMQARRVHIAVVVDEYGGTAGLVTIEDIVEEIVGEIRDEYDYAEELPFQKLKDSEYLFSGRIDLDDVNQITGAQLPKGTSETLGGFIYSQLGKVPTPGEVVTAGGLRLVVEQVSRRRIRKVRARSILRQQVEKESDVNSPAAAE
jgi:CBS domain containing-hemolysin-like protein